jgi:hypothetical protein
MTTDECSCCGDLVGCPFYPIMHSNVFVDLNFFPSYWPIGAMPQVQDVDYEEVEAESESIDEPICKYQITPEDYDD